MTGRRRGENATLAAVLATLLLAGVGRELPSVLARMGDEEIVPATLSTETLDPPTNLKATATLGLVVNLTWTATVDVRATGYRVLRGTANGGPYTQVGTVDSRTTTTFTDLPIVSGTYYYVVRTFFGSWASVNSNQASVLTI